MSPDELFATTLHVIGINPRIQFTHPSGRPMYMIEDGRPLEEVI